MGCLTRAIIGDGASLQRHVIAYAVDPETIFTRGNLRHYQLDVHTSAIRDCLSGNQFLLHKYLGEITGRSFRFSKDI